ncbi:hypothetical protein FKM82_030278 [Ascaphus truei]
MRDLIGSQESNFMRGDAETDLGKSRVILAAAFRIDCRGGRKAGQPEVTVVETGENESLCQSYSSGATEDRAYICNIAEEKSDSF